MISIVLPTLNAEHVLPRALAPLVAGVAEGVVKEAIVVDGGSHDETCAMAEAAGCTVIASAPSLALQLIDGAKATRGEWLLFLDPRTMLQRGWIEEARAFVERDHARTAVFHCGAASDNAEDKWRAAWVNARSLLIAPGYEQGLLIARDLYFALGGYRDVRRPHADLLRRIGRGHIAFLRAAATLQRAATRESSG